MRKTLLAAAVVAVLLGGCATGMKGSARRQCYDAGLQPDTPEFGDCWKAIARRDNAEVLGAVATVGAAAVIADSARPAPSIVEPGQPRRRSLIGIREGNKCVYWMRQGRREMYPVNGICPAMTE